MMRRIHLEGPLADEFSSEPILMDVDNFAMTLRGLQSAFPTFRRKLYEFDDIAIIKQNGDVFKGVDAEHLAWNFGNYPDIHIAVGRSGAAVGAFTAMGYAGWAAVAAYVAVQVAIAIAVSFVMKALADSPDTKEGEQADARASNLFNGAENVDRQGHPVPLVYGTFKVGSVTISTEVVSEKQSVAMNDYVRIDSGASISGNVFGNDLLADTLTLTNFEVADVEYAPGSTYNNGNFSITVAADGAYSIWTRDGYFGTFTFSYKASGEKTPATTANFTVQVDYVYEDYGAGGDS